jgi:hypothetical protein
MGFLGKHDTDMDRSNGQEPQADTRLVSIIEQLKRKYFAEVYYAEGLTWLKEMGFADETQILLALDSGGGDINVALELLEMD